jgi:hypothetical protein
MRVAMLSSRKHCFPRTEAYWYYFIVDIIFSVIVFSYYFAGLMLTERAAISAAAALE